MKIENQIFYQTATDRNYKVGDILEIGFNSGTVKVRINDVKETVKKEQAELLYEVLED